MQNSEIVLYNLSKQANNNTEYKFDRLYRNLYNEDFFIKAYAKIYRNDGSATKGVDDETADGFGLDKIEEIICTLKDESYKPKPVRRTYIPKSNGKTRPLGIPTFTDRIVQEVCRMILEAIYEPYFSEDSHGFRPNLSCHTALESIQVNFRAVNWFIEGDIKGYFDNIDHQTLINILRKKITDERFIRLIWKFLKAGYIEDWKHHKTYSGTPQGGIISPLLANIYLNEFDEFVQNELKTKFNLGSPKKRKRNTEYRKYEARNGRLKKKINMTTDKQLKESLIKQYKENKKIMLTLPYYEHNNEGFKSVKYTRYADDFILGVHGNKEDCTHLKQLISDFLKNELKLDLSEEKTLITHSTKTAKFLGYDIKVRDDMSTKSDKNGTTKRMFNGSVQLLIPDGTIEKKILERKMVRNIDEKPWKILHRPSLQGLSDLEIVETYNAELRGLYNYFSLAENVSHKMWQLRYVMEYSCLKTLAGKYKSKISKMKKKYKHMDSWGIKYTTKKGDKIAYFFNEKLTTRKPNRDKQVDVKPNLYVFQARGELEQRLRAEQCELCGASGDNKKFQVHHVNKLKDLKGKAFWEQVMIARQRKTLIVCHECHVKIHKG